MRSGPSNGYMLGKKGPKIEKSRSFFILFAFSLQNYVFTIFAINTVIFSFVWFKKPHSNFWYTIFMVTSKRISKAPREIYPELASIIKLLIWSDSRSNNDQSMNLLGAKIRRINVRCIRFRKLLEFIIRMH
jgi:hypothetical protein